VKPIYAHYARRRPVYALELPGFGFSERRDRPYTPRLMSDAIIAMLGEIRRHRRGADGAAAAPGVLPIDALALSLSCEFVARVASELPTSFATLALVSPTGFSQRAPLAGPPGSTRGMPLLRSAFAFPLWTRGVFTLLSSRSSSRFFLEKTWGSKEIDEGVLDYSWLTMHQPGARFAPYDFVSGYLFSRDIGRIYQSLQLPVWMVRGVRGDFVDYRAASAFAGKANWTLQTMPTGAFPQFELPGEFVRRYDAFLAAADASG
jgi:pimeloyl-ACP methyl ester carboxylesterase